jgi:hypothetical protein
MGSEVATPGRGMSSYEKSGRDAQTRNGLLIGNEIATPGRGIGTVNRSRKLNKGISVTMESSGKMGADLDDSDLTIC